MKKPRRWLKPLLFSTAVAAIVVATACSRYPIRSQEDTAEPVYSGAVAWVSPSGNDSADGSKEAPFATIEKAIEKLPTEEGGTVLLAAGVYTNHVKIKGAGGPLLIAAAPKAEVIFEGGQPLKNWQPDPKRKGVYMATVSDRESLYGSNDYFDLWDDVERVRYGKLADGEAIQHWPGSVVMQEGNDILFTPHRDVAPKELNLWTNRLAKGIDIERDGVTLQGIRFQNYLGANHARAVSVSSCKNVIIKDCHFRNIVNGVSSSIEGLTVVKSEFREVGQGVRQTNRGGNLLVRECVFESAIGRFRFADIDEHASAGVRIYHKADGATIEENVTTGFWAGLYIKTISGQEGSRPYTIRNNTFLDGIRSGYDCRHPRTTISNNIIGTPSTQEGAGIKSSYYVRMGATLQDNLFIGSDAPENGDPFEDVMAGDLRLKPGITPVGASLIQKTVWNARTIARMTPVEKPTPKLAYIGEPVITTSLRGAVVVTHFSQPVRASLRYREAGAPAWVTAKGSDTTVYPPSSVKASIPLDFEDRATPVWTFALTQGELQPNRNYEYEFSARGVAGGSLPTLRGSFSTKGTPRAWHVAAGAPGETADGSAEHPFQTLQAAINRALPGDTIKLAPGLYSEPALMVTGGTPDARITIQGAGWDKTILDGGKRAGTIVEFSSAPNVSLFDVQIRWFGNYGVMVKNSPRFAFGRCFVWNQSFSSTGVSGVGLQLESSESSVVSGSIFARTQSGVIVDESPGLTFTRNTGMGNVYSALDLLNSARDSKVLYNSLTFTGNRSIYFKESDEAAFQSLVCDYNNYASRVRKVAPKRPENDFTPAERYGTLTGESKGIVAVTMGPDYWRDFHTMKDWREFSGKDQNSVFSDPDYADPQRQDLHPLPGSPNRLRDGKLIGALPIAESAADNR